MKKILLVLSVVFGMTISTSAQLANGSIAPDFTLTDRDGAEHNLYSYLDQGKVVFIKFFACHCPSCWAYHNTGKLEDLYQMYGPTGTDQIMVIMLEYDVNNPEAFSGGGSYTQGDWEAGNSIPMVDVEGTDRTVFDDYNLNYYPMVMKVCTDKRTELMSTGYSTAELFQEADDCPGNLSLEDVSETGSVYLDPLTNQLVMSGFNKLKHISVFNLLGQKNLSSTVDTDGTFDMSSLKKGAYIVQLEHENGIFTQKIVIQ